MSGSGRMPRTSSSAQLSGAPRAVAAGGRSSAAGGRPSSAGGSAAGKPGPSQAGGSSSTSVGNPKLLRGGGSKVMHAVVATPGKGHGHARPQEATHAVDVVAVGHAAGFESVKLSGDGAKKVTTVLATPGQGPASRPREVSYTDVKAIGKGSFGVVYRARLLDSQETVAIKKVLQDKRYKNRELQIMRKLDHCNVVRLRYFFYSGGEKKDDMYLNLVLDFVPETLCRVVQHFNSAETAVPMILVKVYMYQVFRSLAYIHSQGVCHRDIKPQNLLVDPETDALKLCDFGSAKQLVRGETNVSYICSRYYRAPELILGATDYTFKIDVWSAGCVLAELLLGRPVFPGDSGAEQLGEIVKVLGTPTREQIHEMNPGNAAAAGGFKQHPQVEAQPWTRVFEAHVPPEAVSLCSRLLEYTPEARLSPLEACAHAFFAELRQPGARLPSGRELPLLFNFSPAELSVQPLLNSTLVPPHARAAAQAGSCAD